MHPTQNDSGAYHFGKVALEPRLIGSGAGGSGSEQNGLIINRLATGQPFARSAKLYVHGTVTLASGQSLTIAANVQHGDQANLGDADDFGDSTSVVIAATGGALNDQPFVVPLKVDLTGAKQYIRSQQTFTLTASGSDSASVSALFALGGLEHNPVPSGY